MALNKINLAAVGLSEEASATAVYANLFQPTFHRILRQSSVSKSEWQHLFFTFHQYVIWYDDQNHTSSVQLYECLRDDVRESVAVSRDRISNEQDDKVFLQKYVKQWNEFYIVSLYAHLPFQSVDVNLLELPEYAASKNDEAGPIRRMMLTVWNELVLTPFAHRLLKIVSDILIAERDDGLLYGDLVLGVRDSFFYVSPSRSFFEDHYEQMYINTLERYYTQASGIRFSNGNVMEYSVWAEQTFHDEHGRAKRYLVPFQKYKEPITRMNEKLVDILIKNPQIYDAVSSEACRLVEERRSEPLTVLYKLLDRVVDGLVPLIAAVQEHIIRRGKEDMMESAIVVANDPEKYVEKLLSLFRGFAQLVLEAFNDDHRFTSARDRGFQEVVNDTSVFSLSLKGRSASVESRCPEMLANFCDSLLRKTTLSRRLGSEEISQRLKSTLQVLKYVSSKDIFMQFYQTNLARRLLLGLSVDSELEEEMSKSLANVGMPADVISRINRMFSDIHVSQDLSREWQSYMEEMGMRSRVGEIDPRVLNICSWSRPGERASCSVYPEVEEFIFDFEKWYCSKFQGRKLMLAGATTNMVLQFTSKIGTYELEVTLFQWAVIKAFQDCGKVKLSLEAIKIATELPDVELKRTLWTLCTMNKCGNHVIGYSAPSKTEQNGVPYSPSIKDLDQDTRFWLNLNFAPVRAGKPQKRGRINLIGKLQINADRNTDQDQEGIAALREFRIQEAVTKVMKTRKTATMTEIHMEAIEILKNQFLPNRKVLKEQIEFLIEKEYLSRDERDLNVFRYVA